MRGLPQGGGLWERPPASSRSCSHPPGPALSPLLPVLCLFQVAQCSPRGGTRRGEPHNSQWVGAA